MTNRNKSAQTGSSPGKKELEPPPSDANKSTLIRPLRLARRFFLIACMVPPAAFVASYFAAHAWLLELLNNFQWPLFCGMLISFCGFAIARQWSLLIPIIVLLSLSGWKTFSVYVPEGSQVISGQENSTQLFCFNVLHSNDEYEKFLQKIQRDKPDIIVLTEFTPRWEVHLESLNDDYSYRELDPRWMGSGIAVYSRLPLEEVQVFQLTEGLHDCPMICSKIIVGEKSFYLFAVHTLSPRLPEYLEIRNQQLEELADIVNGFPGEKIVVGDFNATMWSPFMRRFLRNTDLLDSRKGRGLQATWPSMSWFFRIPIDHAFCSRGVAVGQRSVEPEIGSDHLPIQLEFQISPTKKD